MTQPKQNLGMASFDALFVRHKMSLHLQIFIAVND